MIGFPRRFQHWSQSKTDWRFSRIAPGFIGLSAAAKVSSSRVTVPHQQRTQKGVPKVGSGAWLGRPEEEVGWEQLYQVSQEVDEEVDWLGENLFAKSARPSSSHHVWRLFWHLYNFLRILRRGLNESPRREDSKTPLKMYEKLSETEVIGLWKKCSKFRIILVGNHPREDFTSIQC